MRCALELGCRSWSDLIRRLLVIVIEDGILHPDLPLLVWLMMAEAKVHYTWNSRIPAVNS